MLLLASSLLVLGSGRALAEDPVVGLWKTIDDETSKPKSIVRLWVTNGELKGKIERTFPEPGEDPDPVCDKCPGDRHNQRIIGMEFLWGFRRDADAWVDGHVLDPSNGKTYHATVRVIDGGRRLQLYGYIKVLIKIGRKQTWEHGTPARPIYATSVALSDDDGGRHGARETTGIRSDLVCPLAPHRLQGAASRGQGEQIQQSHRH
jgi:uncharacterized protein (DUF2147 family)